MEWPIKANRPIFSWSKSSSWPTLLTVTWTTQSHWPSLMLQSHIPLSCISICASIQLSPNPASSAAWVRVWRLSMTWLSKVRSQCMQARSSAPLDTRPRAKRLCSTRIDLLIGSLYFFILHSLEHCTTVIETKPKGRHFTAIAIILSNHKLSPGHQLIHKHYDRSEGLSRDYKWVWLPQRAERKRRGTAKVGLGFEQLLHVIVKWSHWFLGRLRWNNRAVFLHVIPEWPASIQGPQTSQFHFIGRCTVNLYDPQLETFSRFTQPSNSLQLLLVIQN